MTLTFSKVIELPEDYKPLVTDKVLGEAFYHDATHKYIYGSDKPIGVIAYTLDTIGGQTYPRFIHVSITPEFRASDEVPNFLKLTELSLLSEGYTQSFAAIEHGKKYMHKTAVHYGFKEWHKDEDAIYYFKNLETR